MTNAGNQGASNPQVALFKVQDKAINSNPGVNLKEIYTFLGVTKDYSSWAKDRLADFDADLDFIKCSPLKGEQNGGHNKIEYIVTPDVAKHIGMISRTEKGKEVRKWFIARENLLKEKEVNPLHGITDANALMVIAQIATQSAEQITQLEIEKKELIRTKGMIGAGREATAMSKLAITSKKVQKLEKEREVWSEAVLRKSYLEYRREQAVGYTKPNDIMNRVSGAAINQALAYYGYQCKRKNAKGEIDFKGQPLQIETGAWKKLPKADNIARYVATVVNERVKHSLRWKQADAIRIYKQYKAEVLDPRKKAQKAKKDAKRKKSK